MSKNQNEQQKIFEVPNPFKDKYQGKPIKFLNKQDHYELIWVSTFSFPDEDCTIYNDLLVDLKEADKSKEIHVWINSYGGSTSALVMLMQLLEQFEYIVTIGTGEIDSAGFDLWAIGDERYIHSKSICMYHTLSSFFDGKASELKKWGNFISRYSLEFEQMIKAKNILTQEELERGKLTEVYLLGKDLIDRGSAIDFTLYKKRQSMAKIQGFKMDDSFYVKDVQGKYYECVLVNEGQEKREIMKLYLDKMKQNKKVVTGIIEKVGQEFVEFVQNWIKMKGRILDGDGFISDDELYQSYCGMCEPIQLQEIKNKLQQWCQLVDLKFKYTAKKDNKKGFIIQINNEEQNEIIIKQENKEQTEKETKKQNKKSKKKK